MNKNTISINQPLEDLDFFDIDGYKHDGYLGCSNAPVYKYVNINQSNHYLAFKELKIKNNDDYQRIVSNFKTLQRIKSNKHPHIIQILGFCKTIKQNVFNGEDVSAYLIMEHCEGNLDDYIQMIQRSGNQFSLTEIKKFFSQTLSALEFLQTNLSIAHRDIKPENILVHKTNFKIADLDDSKIDLNKTMEKSLVLGTLSFMAPELLKAYNKMKDRLSYNAYKSDIYSLGLCILYMCTFYKFTKNDRLDGVTNKINYQKQIKQLRSQVKVKYGTILSKLLKMMLEIDPILRPDFSALKKMAIEKAFLEESDFYTIEDINKQNQMRQKISIDLSIPKFEAFRRMKQPCILSDSDGTTAIYSSDNQETSEGSQRTKEQYYMSQQTGQYQLMQHYRGEQTHYNNLQSNLPRSNMIKQHSNPSGRHQQISSPEKTKPLSSSHSNTRSNQGQQQHPQLRNMQGIDPNSRFSGGNFRQPQTQTFSFDQKRNSVQQLGQNSQELGNNGFYKQINSVGNNINSPQQGGIQVNFNQQVRPHSNSGQRNNQGQKLGGMYSGMIPEPILEYNSMKQQDERSNTDRTASHQSNYYYQQDTSKTQNDTISQTVINSRTNSQVSCANNETNSHQNNSLYPESQITNSIIAERQNTFTVSEIIRENHNIKIQQQINNQQFQEDEDKYIDNGSNREYLPNNEGDHYYYYQEDAEDSQGKNTQHQQRQQNLPSTDKSSNSSSQNKNEIRQSQKHYNRDINIYDDANQNTCISQKPKKKQQNHSNMVKISEDENNFFDTFIDSQSQTPLHQNTLNSQPETNRRRKYYQFQNPDQIRKLSKQRKTLTIVIVVMILFTIALGLFYIIQFSQSGSSGNSTSSSDNKPDVDPKTYTVDECKLQGKMYLSGKCYSKCPQQNYYPDTEQMICVQCDPSCLECTWGEANSCKKCKNDLYLLSLNSLSGMCVSECPNYFRKDNTVNKCVKCPENCLTCSISSNSLLRSKYILLREGEDDNKSTNTNDENNKSDSNDIQPFSSSSIVCQHCASEYYLLGGNLCVNVCPKDTITDVENRKCVVTAMLW